MDAKVYIILITPNKNLLLFETIYLFCKFLQKKFGDKKIITTFASVPERGEVKQLNTKQYGKNSKRRIYPKRKGSLLSEFDNGCRQVDARQRGVPEDILRMLDIGIHHDPKHTIESIQESGGQEKGNKHHFLSGNNRKYR